jgi:hypothetical protein
MVLVGGCRYPAFAVEEKTVLFCTILVERGANIEISALTLLRNTLKPPKLFERNAERR